MALVACGAPDDEFDRRPVVKSVETGPFRHRFYASPTSTGGAATRFRYGEPIFLVNTVENVTGEIVTCRLDGENVLLDTCPPPTRFVRTGATELWNDGLQGLMICGFEPLPAWFPEAITFPAAFTLRMPVEVKRTEPLPRGRLTLEWRLEGIDRLAEICGAYADGPTQATLLIEVE